MRELEEVRSDDACNERLEDGRGAVSGKMRWLPKKRSRRRGLRVSGQKRRKRACHQYGGPANAKKK